MKTIARLFLLFTLVATAEVFLLLKLAEATNWWVTVGTIVVPGVVGAWLAKRQGARALAGLRGAMAMEREPGGAILDAVLVLFAGALLIAPGVLTDLAGVALLLPPVRRTVRGAASRWLQREMERRVADGSFRFERFSGAGAGFGGRDYEIIDAEEIEPRPR